MSSIKKNETCINNKIIKLVFNIFELNSFSYNEAIIHDKRTCCEYYISLLKIKHPLLFSFCPIKDYNLIIIKLCISSSSFAIYYTVNFIFFDEKAIHKIYEAQGKYDFIYFIPRITISFIVSHFIYIIIKYIFLSERNLLQIRKQNYCFNSSYNIIKRKKKLSDQIYYVFYIRINISWIFLDAIIII